MMHNPGVYVKMTMECVMILINENTDWENVKKNLTDGDNFL